MLSERLRAASPAAAANDAAAWFDGNDGLSGHGSSASPSRHGRLRPIACDAATARPSAIQAAAAVSSRIPASPRRLASSAEKPTHAKPPRLARLAITAVRSSGSMLVRSLVVPRAKHGNRSVARVTTQPALPAGERNQSVERVDGGSADANLEVQMRPGGIAGCSDDAERRAARNGVADAYADRVQVCVQRPDAVAMPDDDEQPPPARAGAGPGDGSRRRGDHGGSGGSQQVDALVETVATSAETIPDRRQEGPPE